MFRVIYAFKMLDVHDFRTTRRLFDADVIGFNWENTCRNNFTPQSWKPSLTAQIAIIFSLTRARAVVLSGNPVRSIEAIQGLYFAHGRLKHG